MLFALALIPAIALLVYIYCKDKKDKEPMGLLVKCFLMGVISIIPSIILELILENVLLDGIVQEGSLLSAIIMGFVVAGMTEELFKFLMLRKITWNRKEFNYMFDGIVYAVFVSLGFAALENVFYVLSGGTSTAIARMFTAIPGHTTFGVYMGYFYSLAKMAEVEDDLSGYRKNIKKALLIPMIIHGLYDSLIMVDMEVVGLLLYVLMLLAWLVLVIILYIRTFKFIKRSSDSDFAFYRQTPPDIVIYDGTDNIDMTMMEEGSDSL